jgi:hypothetical protein
MKTLNAIAWTIAVASFGAMFYFDGQEPLLACTLTFIFSTSTVLFCGSPLKD